MSAARLVCDDVSVRYGSLAAVDAVSLRLEGGRIYGLLGPNGAGKSSLFKALTGREKVAGGTIRLDGHDVTGVPVHRRAREGIVGTYQTPRPFARLSVEDNVALGARVRKLPAPQVHDVTREAMGLVGLDRRAGAPAADLTIYEMRLLEIARSLATDPSVLLLDESLAGIRDDEVPTMMGVVRRVASTGVTIVMVEHILDVIEGATETVFLMDAGRLVATERTDAIRSHPVFQEIYLGKRSTP